MTEAQKPPRGWSRLPAAGAAVAAGVLIALAAGERIDRLLEPLAGPIGATAAGVAVVVVLAVLLTVIFYRALTR